MLTPSFFQWHIWWYHSITCVSWINLCGHRKQIIHKIWLNIWRSVLGFIQSATSLIYLFIINSFLWVFPPRSSKMSRSQDNVHIVLEDELLWSESIKLNTREEQRINTISIEIYDVVGSKLNERPVFDAFVTKRRAWWCQKLYTIETWILEQWVTVNSANWSGLE